MCNVEEQQQENESIDTDVSGEEEDEMELPSKIPRISPATSTSDDDFNLLFGQKKSQQQDNTAQKKVDKELDKYMKEDETDFRKDTLVVERTCSIFLIRDYTTSDSSRF